MPRTFDSPLFTSDQSIDRVLSAGLPVVLVFIDGQAPAALDQEMKRLAKDYAGQLLVVQVLAKDNPEALRRYNARGLPAVLTMREGKELSRGENVSPADLAAHTAYLLGKGPRPAVSASTGANTSGYVVAASGNGTSTARPAGGPTGQAGGGYPVIVTDASFDQEVMRSPVPVVVDFWAPWCGPCRMVAPTLEKLAREWNGKVKIVKIDVDENPMVAGRHGVQSIPTMMVVKEGRIIDRWAGALPEPALRSRLGQVLRIF